VPIAIERLGDDIDDSTISGLAKVLIDTVESGASVGWTDTPSIAESEQWWRDQLASGGTDIWVARDEAGRILGTVSLQRATKKNGLHRAEVAKLMVHRDGRGQGISTQLMNALETFAREDGRTLLLLDTQTGSLAESLYTKWGWQSFGTVAGYTVTPDGGSSGTTFMLKRLD
jgi:GNAT superfamily N-acetyltransferase